MITITEFSSVFTLGSSTLGRQVHRHFGPLGAVMLDAGGGGLPGAIIREIEVGTKDTGELSSYKPPSKNCPHVQL